MGKPSQLVMSVLALALAACQAPALPKRPVASAPPSARLKASAAPLPVPSATASGALPATALPPLAPARLQGQLRAPAGIVSNNGGTIVGNNGGTLISDKGSSLVTDNGAGIVTDNGAGYRLAAIAPETPLAGVRVALLDAAGQPVPGPDGQPLAAVTDAAGRYRIDATLPNRNLILAAALPEGKGTIRAIVPKDGGGGQVVDGDLVSTLTTGYILDQYVAGQGDRLATLDRLPAPVEAETRLVAQQALQAAGAAVPEALTDARVVGLVEALRAGSPALNDQLELVKELLLVAGQQDLGNGQAATEVALPRVLAILPLADGQVDLVCHTVGRVFRLGTDGRLRVVAGTAGNETATGLDGLPAASAGLGELQAALRDAAGRLLLTRPHGAVRVRADGTLEDLWPADAAATLYLAAPGAADGIVVLASTGIWDVGADKQRRLRRALTAEEAGLLAAAVNFGQDAEGRLYVATKSPLTSYREAVYRFDAGTTAVTRLADVASAGAQSLTIDPAGNLFVHKTTGELEVRRPDGTAVAIAGDWSRPNALKSANQTLVGGDGMLQFRGRVVYRVQAGVSTAIAGVQESFVDSLDQVVLSEPAGLVVLPGDRLLVSTYSKHRIVELRPGAEPIDVAGNGLTTGPYNGPALEVELQNPIGLERQANGDLYTIAAQNRLIRITPDGTASVRHNVPGATVWLLGLATTPGGDLFVSGVKHTGDQVTAGFVRRLPGDGGPAETVFEEPATETPTMHYVAVAPDGTPYLLGPGKLSRWTAAGGLELVKADVRFAMRAALKGSLDRMAFDARGRLYFVDPAATGVVRYDPASGVFEAIAGPGTAFFAGTDVEASLNAAQALAFNAAGDLLICSRQHNQIKRIPAAGLQ